MPLAPQSTEAFNQLIRLLADVRDDYVLSPERNRDELDAVEGFAYVFHLLSEGTELFLEGDPERPRFSSIVTPARKFLGDNPDAIYHQALIRGDRSYRVTGTRDREVYISFTIHGRDQAGGINGPILADVNDRQFDIAADGNFELILSPDEQPGQLGEARSGRAARARAQLLPRTAVRPERPRHHRAPAHRAARSIPAPRRRSTTRRSRSACSTRSTFVRATSLGVRVFGEAEPATGSVRVERAELGGHAVELPQHGHRRRRRGRHLLLVGHVRPRPRRRAGHGGHDARLRLRQPGAVEPAHADARVPLAARRR